MRTALGFLAGVVTALLVIFGGVYLVLILGWFPVGADNAPGNLERRLARLARHGYIDRHAPTVQNAMQPTAVNLIEGARLYERDCAVCHGGAARTTSVLRTKFSPPVPQLVARVPHDADGQLFWVTKHGIRLTGMPAWDGVLSDEQIWTIILFLKHSKSLPAEARAAWQHAAVGIADSAPAGPLPRQP